MHNALLVPGCEEVDDQAVIAEVLQDLGTSGRASGFIADFGPHHAMIHCATSDSLRIVEEALQKKGFEPSISY